MKKFLTLFLFLPWVTFGQVSMNFENGLLEGWTQSSPGNWAASDQQPLAGTRSLHHIYNNPMSGNDRISFPLLNLVPGEGETTWQFLVRHGYPPSGANNWCMFLYASRNANEMYPGGNLSGYLVGVNFQGSDDMLKLWKMDNGSASEVVSTGFNWQETININNTTGVKVVRSAVGAWSLQIDTSGGFSNLVEVGTATDYEDYPPQYFGIYYEYSPAQDQKLWVDNISIEGVFVEDTIPPEVSEIHVRNDSLIDIIFNESIDPVGLADPQYYNLIDGGVEIEQISIQDDRQVELEVTHLENDLYYMLIVGGLTDLSGNSMVPDTVQLVHHRPVPYDIVLNEIMPDPSPPLLLPEVEYIEVLNRSGFPLNLEGWRLVVGSDQITLPLHFLEPDSILILCDDSETIELSPYGGVMGLESMPALLNDGQLIQLLDPMGQMISSANYAKEWYNNENKQEGGWSLEQIDPANPCGGKMNWRASEDYKGGTPGSINSVWGYNPDTERPRIHQVSVVDSQHIQLFFTEPLNVEPALDPGNYIVDNNINHPTGIVAASGLFNAFILEFAGVFEPGTIYYLSPGPGITDCSGLSVSSEIVPFAIPSPALPGDLVINEILFNPLPGGSDYIEIYNLSTKVIDIKNLMLSTRVPGSMELVSSVPVSINGYLLFPNAFILLTEDAQSVEMQYFTSDPSVFLEMADLPGYNNDIGTVVLIDRWLQVIDEIQYSDDMHFPLIDDPEGISLERINPSRPSYDPSNWHSASETAGYGTPGLINSQFTESFAPDGDIWVEPELFSPDNDGYNDVVSVYYAFSEPGYVANITLYDARGNVIRKLLQNGLLGTSGSYSWDGLDQGKYQSPMGIYLVYVEVFDLNGRIHRFKRTCVLARRLE